MTGSKKKNKLSPRSKASVPPSPAVSTVHASGVSSLPAGEFNLHARRTPSPGPAPGPVPVDEPPNVSSSAVASSTVSPQSSETKQRGRNILSANDVEKPSTSRWFLRTGTWPRTGSKKSVAVTKVAQEIVSVTSTLPPPIRHEQTVDTPAVIPEEPHNRSSRSLVSAAPESVLTKNSVPSVQEISRAPSINLEAAEVEGPAEPPEISEDTKDTKGANSKIDSIDTKPNNLAKTPAAGSWLGWWYGAPSEPQAPETPKSEEQAAEPPAVEIVIPREPTPPPPPPPPSPPPSPPPQSVVTDPTSVPALDGAMDNAPSPAPRPRSWFGLWGGQEESLVISKAEEETEDISKPVTESSKDPSSSSSQNIPRTEANPAAEADIATTVAAATKQSDTQLLGAQTNIPTPLSLPSSTETGSSAASVAPVRSGWAFWSKDCPKSVGTPSSSNASSTTTVGQLAVADTPSQSNPQKVKVKDIPVLSSTPTSATKPKVARTISNLREETRLNTAKKSDASTSAVAIAPTTPQPSISASSSAVKQTLKEAVSTNHVLPEFESCYHKQSQPSVFCQITRVFKSQAPHPKRHLYLSPAPPRIRKAVAIGVHGFFPMRLVRTVLGEPTGTSIRFANSAAAAIKRWAEKNNVEVEIEKIALEGEGKVGDRVEMLWKLLSNWMDHVKSADFVLMAAHSQGVVVGVQLLARLIEEGCIKEKARVGFTAMAGINLGPFYHLPTTILTGSAKELFEFQKPESLPSQKYMQALKIILKHNVRVLYVGSIDDQLVPLESSSFANISHPYIFRAVFVDGRVHAPDFLSHLVGFAMKLRNQGISDHGLIRELSSPLAGSLYGEGHSRIYDDGQVYDLGVRHALETIDCEGVPLRAEPFELPTNANNPYFLPWSMRGMLEEPHVRNRLRDECMQLLEQFENWKPSSKVLKDVKFRLEGIRSKL